MFSFRTVRVPVAITTAVLLSVPFAPVPALAVVDMVAVSATGSAGGVGQVRMRAEGVDAITGIAPSRQRSVWLRQVSAVANVKEVDVASDAVQDAFEAREEARHELNDAAVVEAEKRFTAAKETLRKALAGVKDTPVSVAAGRAKAKQVKTKKGVFTAAKLPSGSRWVAQTSRGGAAVTGAVRVFGAASEPIALRGTLDRDTPGSVHLSWVQPRGLWNDGTRIEYRVFAAPLGGTGKVRDWTIEHPRSNGVDASVDLSGLNEHEAGYVVGVQALSPNSDSRIATRHIASLESLRDAGVYELGPLPGSGNALGDGPTLNDDTTNGGGTGGGGSGGGSGGGGGGGGSPEPEQFTPTAPVNVAVTGVTYDTASLTWAVPANVGLTGITGYTINVSDDNGATWDPATTIPATLTAATFTATVTGLQNGDSYLLKVAASNTVGRGTWSPAVRVATPAIPAPSAVPGFTGVASTTVGHTVELDWQAATTDPAFPVTEYRVSYRPAGTTDWDRAATVSGTALAADITVASIRAWEFRIAAYNGSVSPWVNTVVTPIPDAPSVIPGMTVTAPTGTTFTLKLDWNTPTDDGGEPITGYDIEQSIAGGTWTTVPGTHPASVTETTLTGLTAEPYRFRIRAVNGGPLTAPWLLTTAVTPTPNEPDNPTNVTGTPGTAAYTVNVTWTAPTDMGGPGTTITKYTVQSTTDNGDTWTPAGTTASTSLTVTTGGLSPVRFRVNATNNGNLTGDWSPMSAAVNPTPPFNNATGGTVTTFVSTGQNGTITGHTYRVHTFATTGEATLTWLTALKPYDYLVVGGGGAGAGGCGNNAQGCTGGSGGAGGAILSVGSGTIPTVGTVSITIGAGATGTHCGGGGCQAGNGGNTVFGSITAYGGGGGGAAANGRDGGSGGGGGSVTGNWGGPWGGGAGVAGQGTPGSTGGGQGSGGSGGGMYLSTDITGTTVTYAPGAYGSGGYGYGYSGAGGSGGGGVVIIRYEIAG